MKGSESEREDLATAQVGVCPWLRHTEWNTMRVYVCLVIIVWFN